MGKKWIAGLMGGAFLSSTVALAGSHGLPTPPWPRPQPSPDGQEVALLVPEGWQLVQTIRSKVLPAVNHGQLTDGATYVYVDANGQAHRVTVTFGVGE